MNRDAAVRFLVGVGVGIPVGMAVMLILVLMLDGTVKLGA